MRIDRGNTPIDQLVPCKPERMRKEGTQLRGYQLSRQTPIIVGETRTNARNSKTPYHQTEAITITGLRSDIKTIERNQVPEVLIAVAESPGHLNRELLYAPHWGPHYVGFSKRCLMV
jgi:hypothetical protein